MTNNNILYPNCQHQLFQTVMNLVQWSLCQIIIATITQHAVLLPGPGHSLVSRWQFWHVHIALDLLYGRTCRNGCGIILHSPERKVPPDWNGANSLRYSHDFFCCWCSLNCEWVLQQNLFSLQQCWIVYLHWDRGPLSARLLCYLPPRSLFELEHRTVLSIPPAAEGGTASRGKALRVCGLNHSLCPDISWKQGTHFTWCVLCMRWPDSEGSLWRVNIKNRARRSH